MTDQRCARQVTAQTLSDYQAHALPEHERQSLAAHVAQCGACQQTLQSYAATAQALRQPGIEPDSLALWRAVQRNLALQERAPAIHRQQRVLAGGLSALGAILLTLIIIIASSRGRPGNLPTPTALTHPTATTSVPATATNIAGLPSPAQTWGATIHQVTLPLNGFYTSGLTPDGRRLTGYRISADGASYQVGWLDVNTHAFTLIETSPVAGVVTPPTCCYTDGRFYIGADSSDNQGVKGAPDYASWYYDTANGQRHTLNPAFFVNSLHDGTIYAVGNTALQTHNLITGVEAVVPGTTLPDTMSIEQPLAFSWPYFAYVTTQVNGDNPLIRVSNVQTGANTILAQLNAIGMTHVAGFALVGDTLMFVLHDANGTSLASLEHVMSPQSQPVVLQSLAEGLTTVAVNDANARLVLLSGPDTACKGGCFYYLIWDRVLHKLIMALPPLAGPTDLIIGPAASQMQLSGNFLAVIDIVALQATVYDLTSLPTQG